MYRVDHNNAKNVYSRRNFTCHVVIVSTTHGYNQKIFIEEKRLCFSIVGKELASVLTGLWGVDIVDIWPYQLWLSG